MAGYAQYPLLLPFCQLFPHLCSFPFRDFNWRLHPSWRAVRYLSFMTIFHVPIPHKYRTIITYPSLDISISLISVSYTKFLHGFSPWDLANVTCASSRLWSLTHGKGVSSGPPSLRLASRHPAVNGQVLPCRKRAGVWLNMPPPLNGTCRLVSYSSRIAHTVRNAALAPPEHSHQWDLPTTSVHYVGLPQSSCGGVMGPSDNGTGFRTTYLSLYYAISF